MNIKEVAIFIGKLIGKKTLHYNTVYGWTRLKKDPLPCKKLRGDKRLVFDENEVLRWWGKGGKK